MPSSAFLSPLITSLFLQHRSGQTDRNRRPDADRLAGETEVRAQRLSGVDAPFQAWGAAAQDRIGRNSPGCGGCTGAEGRGTRGSRPASRPLLQGGGRRARGRGGPSQAGPGAAGSHRDRIGSGQAGPREPSRAPGSGAGAGPLRVSESRAGRGWEAPGRGGAQKCAPPGVPAVPGDTRGCLAPKGNETRN